MEGEGLVDLPPGFRFHPTDEEIISHYLTEKVMNNSFSAFAIAEVDLNKSEPWDLPQKAKMGEKEWYFFCQRDRKYPTGMRTNRATDAGYWKATGKDKEIFKGENCLVGMKKTLVFYRGRAPKGQKTNWVMHEFRLEGHFSYYNLPKPLKNVQDEWVVCRVFHKSTGIQRTSIQELLRVNSLGGEDLFDYDSLPPLMEPSNNINNDNKPSSSTFNNYSAFQNNPNMPAYYSNPSFENIDQAFLRTTDAESQEKQVVQHCKTEHLSSNNHSMQDTGISGRNKVYADLDDLDSLWDY